MNDDTGNEARADRIAALAVERGWSLRQAVRYAVACGYLASHWSTNEQRQHEAGIVQAFNTQPRTEVEDER